MSEPTPQVSPSPQAPPAPTPPINTMALVGFILSFFVSIAGIVCGHIALSQIRRTGEPGREFAIAALAIGYAVTGFVVLFFVVYLVILVVTLLTVGAVWVGMNPYLGS